MISIIITSFREPKTIGRAIESFLQQDIKEKYELFVVAPDNETLNIAKKYAEKYKKKNKQIKTFKDEGKGKSAAINQVLPKIKGRIILLSDGDVYASDNSVNEILKIFEEDANEKVGNKKVGCVSGRPISLNSKDNIIGYWSHLLLDAGAHKARLRRLKKGQFLECSGYLWAFRNKVIKKFPLDVGEDTIVPIIFWLKGYKINYSPKAKVYVKYPNKLNDFLKQKRRAAGAHDNINRYMNPKKIPRMKTFSNEILESYNLFSYPQNIKEFFWTLYLFPVRFYIWLNLFYNSKIRKRKYTDAWKRVETTK